jgi:hypothetical protein
MSTLVEAAPIEGISLENTPPCTVVYLYVPPAFCGKPSVYRVTSTCDTCGTARDFMCRQCFEYLTAGECNCMRHPHITRIFSGYC